MQLLTKHFMSRDVGGHSWLGKTSALCIIPIAQLVDAQQLLAALTADLTATFDATAAHSATEAAVTELRRAAAAATGTDTTSALCFCLHVSAHSCLHGRER